MSYNQLLGSSHDRREIDEASTGEAGGNAGARKTGQSGAAGSTAWPSGSCSGTTRPAETAEAPRGGLDGSPWWERHPERYERELAELDWAGIRWERDEGAFQKGLLRLKLELTHDGEQLPLEVTFPDLFPYFRFEVKAPSLTLPHHQNPFGKNLCLMGRATHHWHRTDTVAGVLQQQLSRTISLGQSDDITSTRGLEEDQAEPYSDYYPCVPSMVVIPGDVAIPDEQTHGTLTVRTNRPPGPESSNLLRGAVVSMRTASGKCIIESFDVASAFSGKSYDGFWAKLPTPIAHAHPGEFLSELLRRVPAAYNAPIAPVAGGHFQFWGVAFPEESSRRAIDGLGWVFLWIFGRNRKDLVAGVGSVRRGPPSGRAKKGRGKRKGRRR